MARVIAVTNQKGGVGKTTTSVNVAASLAVRGQRVLLVDLDPQGNATMGLGVNKRALERSSLSVLLGEASLGEAVVRVQSVPMALLPANASLTAAEVDLIDVVHGRDRLRAALEVEQDLYDYIFIDCPPSLNMLTINALNAAGGVLVPMQCEYYALEGLTAMLDTIERIRRTSNSGLRVDGLLRTMFDPRIRLANDVSAQLLQHFSRHVYETIIPRAVRLAEAPSFGQPVVVFDRNSKAALSYLALADELLRRHRRRDG